ncbi:hypothetical protein Tco_0001098 [Tanacetum coccineum]
MSMTIQSSVKDKILATLSETSKYEYEIRYHPGKANVVTDALSRKERVKPRRVRAMAMIIQYRVRGMILAAQSEAFKQENIRAERLHGFLLESFGKLSKVKMFLARADLCVLDRMSTPTQCCDMGSDGYAYPVYDMFGIVDPNMQNEGQILQGEGSTIPVESHHTPTVAPSTSQPHHSPTLRNFIRQETKVPQPSFPTQTHVADKAASIGVDDRKGGAAT